MVDKYIYLNGGQLTEKAATTASTGASEAGVIVALDTSGKLDPSMFPAGIGGSAVSVVASEALSAGDFVNLWDDTGVTKMRKADATAGLGKQAHGFVLDNVLSAASGTVYFEGQNTALTGLTGGTTYFLSDTTPGGVTATAPTTAGYIVQRLGVAYSTSAVDFERNQPIVRA